MSWTDKELKDVNELAYTLENTAYKKGDTATINGETFLVVDVEIGAEGYHGLAVAPIKADGTADLSQIVVASKGTNIGSSDELKNAYNGKMDAEGSKQIPVADAFVARVAAQKAHTIVKLTGYSQGSYMIKIGAKHHIPVTVFNGWFKYSNLTAAEARYIQNNQHLFVNYRKKNDSVVFMNDANMPEDADVFYTIVWVSGRSHKLANWQFDTEGNIIAVDNPEEQKKVKAYQRMHGVALEKYRLDKLRGKFSRSGGTLSTNEHVYLDEAEALMSVVTIKKVLEQTLDEVIQNYETGIQALEKSWNNAKQSARGVGNALTEYEVMDALYSGGLSEGYVQVKFQAMQDKIKTYREQIEKYEHLIQQIQAGIQTLVAQDTELAAQLA